MTRHPAIGALCAMLAYAGVLSAAEWAPEREPNGALSDAGRICAALALYGEARGEPYEGQAAVVQVVVNRAKAADGDLCSVVLAPGQFEAVENMPIPRMPWVKDRAGWDAALAVTDDVLSGRYTPPCADATSFHVADGAPGCRVGAHVFSAAPAVGGAITAKE